jgi:hypothetical protein
MLVVIVALVVVVELMLVNKMCINTFGHAKDTDNFLKIKEVVMKYENIVMWKERII